MSEADDNFLSQLFHGRTSQREMDNIKKTWKKCLREVALYEEDDDKGFVEVNISVEGRHDDGEKGVRSNWHGVDFHGGFDESFWRDGRIGGWF